MNTSSRPLILLLFANAYAGDLSSVAKERQELLQLLRTEIDKSALEIEVDSIDYTTIDGVLKALNLQQDRLAILHFAGHSGTDLLQLDEGKAYARGIATKLGACPNLKLVFLNGCNNTELVKAIAEEEVPTVIGTRKPVMDKAALRFSKGFFNALAVQRKTLAESWFQGKSDAESVVKDQYRSLDIKQPANTPEWAWFMESRIPDWKLADVAHPCNRLPALPRGELPAKPFKNLYYYTEADAEIFFGRCQAILDVITLLDTAKEPVLLLHGGTGVGKSSFLQAGLIPRLKAPSRQQPVRCKRYSELDQQKNLLEQLFCETDLEAIQIKFEKMSSPGLPVIWILDQLEEIFFDENKEELDALLNIIKSVFYSDKKRPNIKLVFSLRKEWFADLLNSFEKNSINVSHYLLKPFDKSSIVEIIESIENTRLYSYYKLQIKNPPNGRLAERIADDLMFDRQSNISPTLQIILSKLWGRVKNDQERLWNEALYLDEKKSGLLLDDYLSQQLKKIVDSEVWANDAMSSGLLLDVLYQHTTPQGTAKTITTKDYQMLYAHIDYRMELLKALKDYYLVVEPQTNKLKEKYKSTRLSHDILSGLIRDKFNNSELPGQKARREINERKKSWSKIKENEFYGPAFDTRTLSIIEKGRYGTVDWSQDPIEKSIISKSRKQRVKAWVSMSLFSIISLIFFSSILLLTFNFSDIDIENKIDNLNAKYIELKYDLTKMNTYKDKKIKIAGENLISDLKIILDTTNDSKNIFRSKSILQDLHLILAIINFRGKRDDSEIHKKINLSVTEGKEAYLLLSTSDAKKWYPRDYKIKLNDVILNLFYAYSIYRCIGIDSMLEVKKYRSLLEDDFFRENLSPNDVCVN